MKIAVPMWKFCGAYAVHFFTASGAFFAFLAIVAISRHDWQYAYVWLFIAALVDAVDGSLARIFDVKKTVPGIDGALMDNIIDYLTFTVVPVYFIYEVGLVPQSLAMVTAAIILMASAYQFSQKNAKTDDHFFVGFPSYWNVVAIFLFWSGGSVTLNLAILLFLVMLSFIPIYYIYPSRTRKLMPLTLALFSLWGVFVVYVMFFQFDSPPLLFMILSYGLFLYYFLLSIYLSVIKMKRGRS